MYLLKIHESGIQNNSDVTYLINKETRFNIDDASINILTNKYGQKKLIVCFKTIFINKYTVHVIDVDSKFIEHIHISDQLWESKSLSILNPKSKDLLKLNSAGLNLIVIDSEV